MEQPHPGSELNLSQDLIRIHAAITRGLETSMRNAANYLERDGYPDDDLRIGYRQYVRTLLTLLTSHHTAEDVVVWSFLQERIPGAPYEILIDQHKQLKGRLEATRQAFESEDLAALHATLAALFTVWQTHIELEEATFSKSIANRHISPEEQGALSERLAQYSHEHAEPSHLVIPFILYNLPPQEREWMTKRLPVDVALDLVPGPWREKWAPMQPFFYPA